MAVLKKNWKIFFQVESKFEIGNKEGNNNLGNCVG